MDIKAKVEELVKKITGDKELKAQFEKNPAAVIETLVGVDLPDEQVNAVVAGVKAKLGLDDVLEMAGKLKGLFGK